MEFQGILNNQNDPKKKNKFEELILPDFKTYYKGTDIMSGGLEVDLVIEGLPSMHGVLGSISSTEKKKDI
jgi:hypothetical protein